MNQLITTSEIQSSIPKKILGGNIFHYALSQAETIDLLSQSLDIDVRAIDTADVYSDGQSEIYIGEYLRISKKRDSWFIASKIGVKNQDDANGLAKLKIMKSRVKKSLKRMGIDYLDLIQLHHIDRSTNALETFEAVHNLKQLGLVKSFGICNVNLSYLRYLSKINLLHNLDYIQIYGNWLRKEEFEAIINYLKNTSVKILGYGMLGRGVLASTNTSLNENITDIKSRRNLNPSINQEAKDPELLRLLSKVEAYLKGHDYTLKDLAIAYYFKNKAIPIVACRTIEHLKFFANASPKISSKLLGEVELIILDFLAENSLDINLGKPHIKKFITNKFV